MNAYEIPALRFSLPAGGAIPIHRFVGVDNEAAVVAGTSNPVIGASYNETASGEVAEICDGIVMVEAAEEIFSGTLVSSDATGKAIAAVADTQAELTPFAVTPGTIVAGIAITSAAADGDLISIKIN
jgi:hypothetical protein